MSLSIHQGAGPVLVPPGSCTPAHLQAGISPEHPYAVQQAMQGPGLTYQWARSRHMEQGLPAKLARGQPSVSEHSIVVGPAKREAGGGLLPDADSTVQQY